MTAAAGPDYRPPEVITDRKGRKVLIDQAVLDPMRGHIPLDELSGALVHIHALRPQRVALRLRGHARPQC